MTVTQWVKLLKKSHFISLGKSDQKYLSALRKAKKIGGRMVPNATFLSELFRIVNECKRKKDLMKSGHH